MADRKSNDDDVELFAEIERLDQTELFEAEARKAKLRRLLAMLRTLRRGSHHYH